jgi:hypothetical protein
VTQKKRKAMGAVAVIPPHPPKVNPPWVKRAYNKKDVQIHWTQVRRAYNQKYVNIKILASQPGKEENFLPHMSQSTSQAPLQKVISPQDKKTSHIYKKRKTTNSITHSYKLWQTSSRIGDPKTNKSYTSSPKNTKGKKRQLDDPVPGTNNSAGVRVSKIQKKKLDHDTKDDTLFGMFLTC